MATLGAMADCPNCGADVAPRDQLCRACGFDIHSGAAEEVRRLRLEGRIKPGRIGAPPRGEAPRPVSDAQAAEPGRGTTSTPGPERADAGL